MGSVTPREGEIAFDLRKMLYDSPGGSIDQLFHFLRTRAIARISCSNSIYPFLSAVMTRY